MKKQRILSISFLAMLSLSGAMMLSSNIVSAVIPGWYDLNWGSLINSTISNITGDLITGLH